MPHPLTTATKRDQTVQTAAHNTRQQLKTTTLKAIQDGMTITQASQITGLTRQTIMKWRDK